MAGRTRLELSIKSERHEHGGLATSSNANLTNMVKGESNGLLFRLALVPVVPDHLGVSVSILQVRC